MHVQGFGFTRVHGFIRVQWFGSIRFQRFGFISVGGIGSIRVQGFGFSAGTPARDSSL